MLSRLQDSGSCFNFENLSTFDYCSSVETSQGKVQQGEKIRIENNNIVSIRKGE